MVIVRYESLKRNLWTSLEGSDHQQWELLASFHFTLTESDSSVEFVMNWRESQLKLDALKSILIIKTYSMGESCSEFSISYPEKKAFRNINTSSIFNAYISSDERDIFWRRRAIKKPLTGRSKRSLELRRISYW